jgi:hypothetical protein
MSIERTAAASKAWLTQAMPANFVTEMTADELNIISHTLVYSEQFEEYVHLHFKTGAIIISLARDGSDETIFKVCRERFLDI